MLEKVREEKQKGMHFLFQTVKKDFMIYGCRTSWIIGVMREMGMIAMDLYVPANAINEPVREIRKS